MNYLCRPRLARFFSSVARPALVCALAMCWQMGTTQAGTFTWGNPVPATGNWSVASNWLAASAPTGSDPTDILIFSEVGAAYVSTNDFAGPFLMNQFTLQGPTAGITVNLNASAANLVRMMANGGTLPRITQNAASDFTFVQSGTAVFEMNLGAPLTLTGNGTGVVTLNNTISGNHNITKTGTSTFRFGGGVMSLVEQPSHNTWFGSLILSEGTIRFNNNASTGRTALRANPVTLSAGTLLNVSSELRVGTLSGAGGTVQSLVTGTNVNNENIVIYALTDGTFAGTLQLGPPTGTGNDNGVLIIRGAATQTLTGTLAIQKDVAVGRGAALVLAASASLSGQLTNAGIVMNGGTFRLDNSATNNNNRVRDGATDSTGVDVIGGGLFSLVGNAAGTTEVVSRLQLGSVNNSLTTNKPRSGALTVNVTHNVPGGGTQKTVLAFQAYTRDSRDLRQFATVDFTASGNTTTLGAIGTNSARVTFSGAGFTVPLSQGLAAGVGLLDNTGIGTGTPVGTADWGWATVNGTDFASYFTTIDNSVQRGVVPATVTTFAAATVSTNALLTATASSATSKSVQSLKIQPGASQTLDITGAGHLNTKAILLAGANDFEIRNTGAGTGGISGVGTRYFHVQQAALNVNVSLAAANEAVVKAGAGTLVLGSLANSAVTQPTVINAGALRATPGTSLPAGELRLRGGVLEIAGGVTFNRSITSMAPATNTVNWSGVDLVSVDNPAFDEDRGSGGFAAFGANARVDLNTLDTRDNLSWEDKGFLNSGHALVFGSERGNAMVEWFDNLNIGATQGTINYNAREIRVIDNTGSTADFARISGAISGKVLLNAVATETVHNDLLKTGAGVLELTGTNTYLGATLVQEGTLLVNGSLAASYLTNVRNGGILGGGISNTKIGTVGAVRVESGGRVAPGSNAAIGSVTGVLATGNFELTGAGAQLEIQLGGTTAGLGFDEVTVTGSVALNGAQFIGSLINGFVPQPADLFFIILNDGSDAVQGTFQQGSSVTFNGTTFDIGYAGHFTGNIATSTFTGGNDVVLRAIPEPSSAVLLAGAALLLGLRRRREG